METEINITDPRGTETQMVSDYALESGTQLKSATGTYTVISKLGAGGFGITYKVSFVPDSGGPTTVMALKEHFLKSDCIRDVTTFMVQYSGPASQRYKASLKDFITEANRLKRLGLQPKNVIKVNEVFEANGTAYYSMDFLSGGSLATKLKELGRPMTEAEMAQSLIPVADALEFLHANHVTHLDVKPENIMLQQNVDGTERPVLIDFGLSKHYNEQGQQTSTFNMQGVSEGFSPMEQYLGLTEFSPQTDVYATAATAYYLLTTRKPPKASELNVDKIAYELKAYKVSRKTISTLTAALAPHPKDRTKDMAAFKKGLSHIKDTTSVKPAPPVVEKLKVREEKETDGLQTKWRIAISAAVILIAAAVAACIWLIPDGSRADRNYYAEEFTSLTSK
ncbi:MAG: serine/threonine protein kinase [Muribaculaceae bacterium]|nr:serine/threonine protein kinase [Muribaculaceae bacterium]